MVFKERVVKKYRYLLLFQNWQYVKEASDPDPNWGKYHHQDPDPNTMYLDPQPLFVTSWTHHVKLGFWAGLPTIYSALGCQQ